MGDKWFCLFNPDEKFVDVKCDPAIIKEMRATYQAAFPAWHMNKEHWLGIKLDSDMPDDKIKELVREAYQIIVDHLRAKKRQELGL